MTEAYYCNVFFFFVVDSVFLSGHSDTAVAKFNIQHLKGPVCSIFMDLLTSKWKQKVHMCILSDIKSLKSE